MFRFILVLALLWTVPAGAVTIPQSLDECTALCAQYFPGGVPVTPPVAPPVTPPSGNKTFPYPITFERSTDQGNGSAGILFRTLQSGSIISVSVNGEVARLGVPYKGSPVFLLTKSGDQYARPLVFVVRMADGETYTAKSGTAVPVEPVTPGVFKNKAEYDSYGDRNGGRQAWRIPKSGKDLGPGPIKFVFASGKTFIVKNPLKNCRGNNPDTCDISSDKNKDGFVYKPGIGPNGEGDNDTGTSHGGIYLHAPYGDGSKTVTMYW